MRFASLGSGSEGNALLVAVGRTQVLMDCGFGLQDTVTRLARKFNLPVWLTHGTLRSQEKAFSDIANIREIDPQLAFAIGDIEIIPYSVPHDACLLYTSDAAEE